MIPMSDPRRVEAAVAAVVGKLRTEKRGNSATPIADARTVELIGIALRAYDEWEAPVVISPLPNTFACDPCGVVTITNGDASQCPNCRDWMVRR